MQALETLQNAVKKLAAGVAGQSPNVRTFQGRQLMLFHKTTPMFMLPQTKSDPIQDLDPLSASYGLPYFMVDIDPLNSTDTAGIQ